MGKSFLVSLVVFVERFLFVDFSWLLSFGVGLLFLFSFLVERWLFFRVVGEVRGFGGWNFGYWIILIGFTVTGSTSVLAGFFGLNSLLLV